MSFGASSAKEAQPRSVLPRKDGPRLATKLHLFIALGGSLNKAVLSYRVGKRKTGRTTEAIRGRSARARHRYARNLDGRL